MLTSVNVTKADCQSQLSACDNALTACIELKDAQKKELSLCKLGLSQTLDKAVMLQIEVDDKTRELNSWYRNPFILAPLGIISGILIWEAVR